jgi:hypothetical protein
MKDLEDLISEHGLKFLENVLTKEKELPDSLIKIIIKEGNVRHLEVLIRNIELKDIHISNLKNFIKKEKQIVLLILLYCKKIINIEEIVDFIEENIANQNVVKGLFKITSVYKDFKETGIFSKIYKKHFYNNNKFVFNKEYLFALREMIYENLLSKDENIEVFHLLKKKLDFLIVLIRNEDTNLDDIISELKLIDYTKGHSIYFVLLETLLSRSDLNVEAFLFLLEKSKLKGVRGINFEYLKSEEVLVFILENVNKTTKYNIKFSYSKCRIFAKKLFRLYFKKEYLDKYHYFLEDGEIFQYPLSEYIIETVVKNQEIGYREFSLLLRYNGNNIDKETYIDLFKRTNKLLRQSFSYLQFLFTEKSKDIIGVGEISFLFEKIKTDLDFRIVLSFNKNLTYETYHKLSRDNSKQVRRNLVDSCNNIEILQHLSIDKISEIKNAAIKKLELLSN